MEGKVTGEASPNSLTNLAESGVLTLDWVENYLKKNPKKKKLLKQQTKHFTFVNYNNIMITKTIDENLISVIPEDSEDLLNLRRIIKENDKVIGDTTRVLKQDKDYARPDKGERIRIRIALTVEKIYS